MSASDGERLWSEALQVGAKLGQQLFGLSVEVMIRQDSPDSVFALYNPHTDHVEIFRNQVARSVAEGVEMERLVTYAVAHEFGHACEARCFAEYGVFPWDLRTDGKSRLWTEEGFYLLKDIFPQFAQLNREIQDFPIGRRLSEYGIKDPTAKVRFRRIQWVWERQSTQPLSEPKLRLQELFHLPSAIQDHMFGDISSEARTETRQFMTLLLGAAVWEKAARLMSRREFGDIPGYEKVIADYYADFLGLRATFESTIHQALGDLPAFWISPTYRVQHVRS